MEKLITKGAEADLYLTHWCGKKAVRKVRKAKSYRHPSLDIELRRYRTYHESGMLRKSRMLGVTSPLVYFVDLKEAEIIMQWIEGQRLRELFDNGTKRELASIGRMMGEQIAKLHNGGIAHGDLTTSNFILTRYGNLSLLDFGLSFFSKRAEDRAVDLHLIREVLDSAHSRLGSGIFSWIMDGYRKVLQADQWPEISKALEEIRRRGRYSRVD